MTRNAFTNCARCAVHTGAAGGAGRDTFNESARLMKDPDLDSSVPSFTLLRLQNLKRLPILNILCNHY